MHGGHDAFDLCYQRIVVPATSSAIGVKADAQVEITLAYSLFANSEWCVIKPQDIVVGLKLALSAGSESYAALAKVLGMSASEVHAAVGRLADARLLDPDSRKIRRKPFVEFLLHGVPYAFPVAVGEMTRGVPTAWAAPVMSGRVATTKNEAPVWPEPDGTCKGLAVEPLYRTVPTAAANDPALYELLALVDAVRLGRARERAMATKQIERRLNHG